MSTQYKKHIIFTGGSSGIGYEATKVLAADPETHIVVLSRSPPKDLPDNVEFHKFDLSDPESVRSCAEWWPYPPADAFVGCAGIGGTPKVTYIQDGIEQTFATNHLGHALLIFLLNDRGAFAPNARISFVGSSLHDPENPSSLKPY
ncbi:uncharacterized protein EHS24_005355 [Apiotrichum porosum]|uniref:NAD-dependent epimerase/dehydratase domain-containing protein n=1 Tax=Apiotrichum porosum TaxID=105984 RepID=A0A427XDG2_9TREE|nr:uncharacterized protein EHS24_005355 [Apiotrichum porosum]RSH76777.1 hypothetical protein EHS24_005355 [Apiotrichum porosum]